MNVVRELVTLLRYEVDDSGLQKYQQAYSEVQNTIARVTESAVQRMRESLRQAATLRPAAIPTPAVSTPTSVGLPSVPRGAAAAVAGVGAASAFPVNVADARARIGQVQAAYGTFMAKARSGLHTVREIGIGTWEGIRLGIQDARQAQDRMTRAQWQGVRVLKEQAGAFSGLRQIVGTVFGVAVVRRIFSDIDAWGQMEARMRQATTSAQEYSEVDQQLARVARLTYKSYESSAELFVRTRRTMADLGKSTQDTVDVTEGLALGMALSSTKAQDQESVIASLTTAIMQGKLAMHQYSTLMRAAPRLQVALADGLGLTTDKLLEQVKAGRLTSDRFLPALQSQLVKMRIEAQDMPVTMADAMTVWNNAFQRFWGQAWLGRQAVLAVTRAFEFLADHVQTVVGLLALTGGAWGLVKLRAWLRLATVQSGGLIRSLVSATRAAIGLDTAMALRRGPAGARRMLALWNRALVPMLRMAALLYTIYLLMDDIGVWYRGGDSMLGDLIGPVEEWKDEIQTVKTFLIQIKDMLGGAGKDLKPWLKGLGTILIMAYGLWKIFRGFLWVLGVVRDVFVFLATRVVPMLWRAFVMTPWGRIAALVISGLWLIWKYWDQINKALGDAWNWLRSKAKSTFFDPVLEYIDALWTFWVGLVRGVVALFTGDWDGAIAHWRNAFSGLWKFFEDIGGRMIAKIQEIGAAITKWITDKVEAAAKWLERLLPGDMLPDDQKAAMAAPKELLGNKAVWQAFAGGAGIPLVSNGAAVRAGAPGARGPMTVEIHNETTVNAPGADPGAVAGATARGLANTQRRSIDRLAEFLDFHTGVEAAR